MWNERQKLAHAETPQEMREALLAYERDSVVVNYIRIAQRYFGWDEEETMLRIAYHALKQLERSDEARRELINRTAPMYVIATKCPSCGKDIPLPLSMKKEIENGR